MRQQVCLCCLQMVELVWYMCRRISSIPFEECVYHTWCRKRSHVYEFNFRLSGTNVFSDDSEIYEGTGYGFQIKECTGYGIFYQVRKIKVYFRLRDKCSVFQANMFAIVKHQNSYHIHESLFASSSIVWLH